MFPNFWHSINTPLSATVVTVSQSPVPLFPSCWYRRWHFVPYAAVSMLLILLQTKGMLLLSFFVWVLLHDTVIAYYQYCYKRRLRYYCRFCMGVAPWYSHLVVTANVIALCVTVSFLFCGCSGFCLICFTPSHSSWGCLLRTVARWAVSWDSRLSWRTSLVTRLLGSSSLTENKGFYLHCRP